MKISIELSDQDIRYAIVEYLEKRGNRVGPKPDIRLSSKLDEVYNEPCFSGKIEYTQNNKSMLETLGDYGVE